MKEEMRGGFVIEEEAAAVKSLDGDLLSRIQSEDRKNTASASSPDNIASFEHGLLPEIASRRLVF